MSALIIPWPVIPRQIPKQDAPDAKTLEAVAMEISSAALPSDIKRKIVSLMLIQAGYRLSKQDGK